MSLLISHVLEFPRSLKLMIRNRQSIVDPVLWTDFFSRLSIEQVRINELLSRNVPTCMLPLSEKQLAEFSECTICRECNGPLTSENKIHQNMRRLCPNDEQFELLRRKGVFPGNTWI